MFASNTFIEYLSLWILASASAMASSHLLEGLVTIFLAFVIDTVYPPSITMKDTDYKRLIKSLYVKRATLYQRRTAVNAEIDKITQLLFAAANMLPENERDKVILEKLRPLAEADMAREASLRVSIGKIHSEANREWLTVRDVRDRLIAAGFNFSNTVSPLASISTTSRRMNELENKKIEGVNVYRLKEAKIEE
ncbi:MAG: hypothetical protein WBE86_00845 [Candidatus Acidiferrales bacterium]